MTGRAVKRQETAPVPGPRTSEVNHSWQAPAATKRCCTLPPSASMRQTGAQCCLFLSPVRCTHSSRQGVATPRSLRDAFDPCSFLLFLLFSAPLHLCEKMLLALYRFEWVTNEKGSSAKTLAEVQNCFTTKDTKVRGRSV